MFVFNVTVMYEIREKNQVIAWILSYQTRISEYNNSYRLGKKMKLRNERLVQGEEVPNAASPFLQVSLKQH